LGSLRVEQALNRQPGGLHLKPLARGEDDEVMQSTGDWKYVKHAVTIDGIDIGWGRMPVELGNDEPRWS
jgi:hypothetical protein